MLQVDLDSLLVKLEVHRIYLPSLVQAQQQSIVVMQLVHAQHGTETPCVCRYHPLKSEMSRPSRSSFRRRSVGPKELLIFEWAEPIVISSALSVA